jgi:hypothetical protein
MKKRKFLKKKCLSFALFITGADAISLGLLVLFTRLHTVAVYRVLAKLPKDSRVCGEGARERGGGRGERESRERGV